LQRENTLILKLIIFLRFEITGYELQKSSNRQSAL